MALPQQGTETTKDLNIFFNIVVLMALPQQGTETSSTSTAIIKYFTVLMALPQQGTET